MHLQRQNDPVLFIVPCHSNASRVGFVVDTVSCVIMANRPLNSADQLLRLRIQLLELIDLLTDHLLNYAGQLIS
jgi:hypothetical protein